MGTDNRKSDFKKKTDGKRRRVVYTGPQRESRDNRELKALGAAGRETPSLGNLDADRALLRHLDALAKGEVGKPAGDGSGFFGRARESIADLMDAARRRVAEVPVEDTVEAGPPGFQALALPSLDDFLAPYIAAEGAANEAYEASKGVIEESAQTLVDRLNRGQEQFVADREGLAQQEAIQRRMQAQELDQIVAPSGLAKELGVDNDIAAEGALLKGLAQMANQSQDEINNNMAESQARGFQSRLEGAESSKAASLATAANTLQALLAQIGVGKADAQREYTSEANRIRATNQQNELAARQQWLQEQEAQRQAEERLAADRQALIDKHSMDAWEAQAPLRRQRNPRAFGFIESVLKNVAGDSRSPQAKQAVLQALPGLMQTARESGQGTFNEQVLRGWIDEYFSGKRILDEEALMRDPAARGLG